MSAPAFGEPRGEGGSDKESCLLLEDPFCPGKVSEIVVNDFCSLPLWWSLGTSPGWGEQVPHGSTIPEAGTQVVAVGNLCARWLSCI